MYKNGGKIPKKYTQKLSRKDKKRQIKNIKTTKKAYKNKKYVDRPKLKSYKNKKSSWTQQFHKKYPGVTSIRDISKKTKIPEGELRAVLKKGRGAYYSSGSRPNQTSESWGRARMYSYILGGPTRKYDKAITEKYKKQRQNLRKNKTIGGRLDFWNKSPQSIKIDPNEEEEWKKRQYSQLRKDKSAPSMRMKLKEDNFNKIAKQKFSDLELDRLNDLDDQLFLTPVNSKNTNDELINSSFRTVNDNEGDEELINSSFRTVNDNEGDDEFIMPDFHHESMDIAANELKQESEENPTVMDIKYNLTNLKNYFLNFYSTGIDVIMPLTKEICNFLDLGFMKKMMCNQYSGYNIHFNWNSDLLVCNDITDNNRNSIINNWTLIKILNKAQNHSGEELTNEEILKLTCENINMTMFGFNDGGSPLPLPEDGHFDPRFIEYQELYINSSEYSEFNDRDILYLQLYGFDKTMSLILDFREFLDVLQETKPSIMPLQVKPQFTISYCDLYKTKQSCEGECDNCLVF